MSVRFRITTLLLLAGVLASAADSASAGEFRSFHPIGRPAETAASVPVSRPVERRVVESAVRDILASWGSSGFADRLAPGFYDAQRLVDAVDGSVPRDAALRVLAIEGVQTLSQQEIVGEGGIAQRRSVVSATVRTQLEFNDPSLGFQRREGTNELLLEVIESPVP